VNDIVRRGRAWIPVAKAAALFLLPMPLFFAAILDLASGDLGRFALTGGGLASFFTAGTLMWRALVAEARYLLGQRLDPPAFPLKATSLVLTALGTAAASLAGGNSIAVVIVIALLAAVGHWAFYGADLRKRRVNIPRVNGIDIDSVTAQVKQAYGRLRGIEAAARNITVREFGERLERIIDIGRDILAEIERDPRDASRARRFLNVYLDSAEKVTTQYAQSHRKLLSQPLEQNFRQLLIDMEQNFSEQRKKLLESDAMILDADIEVLKTRLKREGIT
jgi:5-bromo-4-chloroindolyl phosphate hydrolysis protein